jgi:CHAT domain-containing protein/Tfp pilus assembly protein PilF
LVLSGVSLWPFACRSPESVYDTIKLEVDRGEFNSTLTETDTALRQYGTGNTEWEWRFRLLKARILVSRSQGEDALSLLKPEPPAQLPSTEIREQRKLYQGIAHRYIQQFTEAERDFAETERLAESLPPFYACQLLIARAALWVDEKKYDAAQADYREALTLARNYSLPGMEAASLADLARLTTSQNHFDEALDLYVAALQLAKSLEMKGNSATILGNMGWSYFELGNFDSALDFYSQGAEASGKSGLPGYSAYWFTGVANSYVALREYARAEELARTTLKRAHDLKNAQVIKACLNTLTEITLRTGRLGEAEQYNQEALTAEDKFGTLDALLFAGDIAIAKKNFSNAEELFRQVLAEPNSETAVKWQAEAGLAQVWDDQRRFVEAERQYLRAISTIEQARRSIHHDELRLSFLSSGIEVYGEYIDFLVRRGRSADALNQAELSRARTLAEGLSANDQAAASHVSLPRPSAHVQPQQLAQRLHATILVYWLGEKHSYLWAVTPSRTTCFTLPPASEIEPLIKSYRELTIKSGDVLNNAASAGEKLYASLVEPAKKVLPPGSRVILLPDASLYGLNFETLIVPEPQPHFWIEDVTLTTASSLTLLSSSVMHATGKGKSLLLVGNTEPPNTEFPRLAQAPAEMEKIGHHFPDQGRKVLEGKAATATAYLSSNPERYSYLHFVTHGTASRTRPLESAVILSPEGDSYKLYARDIVLHRLNANLVTISACNGSGTRTYSGEGLVGLSWAFLHAGAHNVIGALWEVSDASTPQLMDALYGELSQGKDPATALRDAKLSLLHSSDPSSVFKKPFYWAPFQLYAGS